MGLFRGTKGSLHLYVALYRARVGVVSTSRPTVPSGGRLSGHVLVPRIFAIVRNCYGSIPIFLPMTNSLLPFPSLPSATSRIPMFRDVFMTRFLQDFLRFFRRLAGNILGVSVRGFSRLVSVLPMFFLTSVSLTKYLTLLRVVMRAKPILSNVSQGATITKTCLVRLPR